jgi:F-type H+-transporting ATPase subunit epsilon
LANTIKLEIVSPQKVVYSTDVNILIVKSTAGELGFLPNHAPLVAGLMPAPMRLLTDGGEELVSVSGGFVEVQPKKNNGAGSQCRARVGNRR